MKSKNPKVAKGNKGKLILLSKCAVFNCKKLRFIRKQKASGLLSSLGLKTGLSKIPLLGEILLYRYKMKEIVNKR